MRVFRFDTLLQQDLEVSRRKTERGDAVVEMSKGGHVNNSDDLLVRVDNVE